MFSLQRPLSALINSLSPDFIGKVIETFATRISIIGIGLATTVIMTRILGPEGRGLYATAATIGAIGVQFGNLGLHASNTYLVAQDRKLLPVLLSNTLAIGFGFGGISAILAWLFFTFWPTVAPVEGTLLILALGWIPFGLTYMLLQNLLLGIQEVRAYNRIELVMQIVGSILIVLVIVLKMVTVETIFASGLIVLIFCVLWALQRLKTEITHIPAPSVKLFKENILYGMKAYLVAFFSFLVLKIDLLMVKYLLGSQQAGYYSIAATMADMVCLIPVVIGTILFPKLSAMSNMQEKFQFTKRSAITIGIIMLVLVLAASLLSKFFVTFLFGSTFLPSVPAFIWLMPGIFFLGIEVVAVQFLNSIGFPKSIVIVWAFCSALNIGLNFLAIPRYGIIGASIVSSFCYCMVFALVIAIIKRSSTRLY